MSKEAEQFLMKYGISSDTTIGVEGDNLLTDLLEAFADQEKAENKWISVEERLPEKHKNVLLTTKTTNGEDAFIGYLGERQKFYSFEAEGEIRVTHWQPLPEPPKQ